MKYFTTALALFTIANACTAFADPSANAPILLGADAVLQAAARAQPDASTNRDKTKAISAFVEAARKLRREQASLSPSEAAKRWQALWFQMDRINPDYDTGISAQDLTSVLIASLPRPESWPLLAPANTAQAPQGPNSAVTASDPSLLQSLGFNGSNGDRHTQPDMRQLVSLILTKHFDDAESLCKNSPEFLHAIRALRNQIDVAPLEKTLANQDSEGADQRIDISDILPRLGLEQTQAIATRLLKKPVRIGEISGEDTLAVFRQTALKYIQELPRAPWELCCSTDGAALYDALIARFGDPFKLKEENAQDYRANEQRQLAGTATAWRALGFLRAGDKDRAADLLTQIGKALPNEIGYSANPFSDLSSQGIAPTAVYEVLRKSVVQTRCPWLLRTMIELAPAADQIDDALTLLAPTSSNVSALDQLRFCQLELSLRLAQGNREAAFKILEKALAVSIPTGPEASEGNPSSMERYGSRESPIQVQSALINQAIEVGLLTNHNELVESAITTLSKLVDALPPTKQGDPMASALVEAADMLLKKDRLSAAEALLARALARTDCEQNAWEAAHALSRLVQLYDRAHRPADVLKLLTTAPQWSMRDLADPSAETELQLYAARAFASDPTTKEKALTLTYNYLEHTPSDDDGYLLLLDLVGEKALPFLEKLAAADRWEERPLIWKAELLRRSKHLPEAEKSARDALAIDPTDGEQPPGKRVRGYAVLANILDDAGRPNDAKIYHQVVESVHIAEEGDALKQAGLVRDALAKYESAATFFADAYCIQWRLAERLMKEGRIAEAEKHYEVAFTRMPEQFGRMAHVCFGCENIFGSQTSRSAADRVLSRLAALPNPHPQALLILARLRIQQDRPSEAYALLQHAVELDGDYMDAWKELLSLIHKADIPPAERQRIVKQLLTLDPSGTHNGISGDNLFILGPEFLWERLQNVLARPAPVQTLLPLTAAALRMDTAKDSPSSWQQQQAQRQRLLGEYNRTNRWNENGWEFVLMLEQIGLHANSVAY